MSEPLEPYAEENGSARSYVVQEKTRQNDNLRRSKFDLRRHAPTLVDVSCGLGIDVSSWYSLWNLLLVPSGNQFNIAKVLVYGTLTGIFLYSYKLLNEIAERAQRDAIRENRLYVRY